MRVENLRKRYVPRKARTQKTGVLGARGTVWWASSWREAPNSTRSAPF